jgi:hypothetical protein
LFVHRQLQHALDAATSSKLRSAERTSLLKAEELMELARLATTVGAIGQRQEESPFKLVLLRNRSTVMLETL